MGMLPRLFEKIKRKRINIIIRTYESALLVHQLRSPLFRFLLVADWTL